MIEVDNAVGVLNNGAGRRTRPEAARVHAMHALILRHEPQRRAYLRFCFVEFDQIPEVVSEVRHCLISAFEIAEGDLLVIPLLAGDFTRFTADARGRIDHLRDRVGSPGHAGRLARCRRNRLDESFDHIFSMLTRNPLYSGVPEFGSTTLGLRLFTSGPDTRPMKPQCIGRPI